ncbi:hypothetical protein [uncultured Microbulbifer sp.]|uniref:hypothetical protein n=1 Tax=uncultured Microbulbifer sp. TaxID=348147 RepID=UPI002613AD5D|nr:hypothetical protein [uncultured Microbulbifer sp.]
MPQLQEAKSHKTAGEIIDESVNLHLELLTERGIRNVDVVERKQAIKGKDQIRKKHPCPGCSGEGLLETLTFYAPLGATPGSFKRSDGSEVASQCVLPCFVCEGTGIDFQAFGIASKERAAVLKMVK